MISVALNVVRQNKPKVVDRLEPVGFKNGSSRIIGK
jgi:hypothetical protein